MNISNNDFETISFCSNLVINKGVFDDNPLAILVLERTVKEIADKKSKISKNSMATVYASLQITKDLITNKFEDVQLDFAEHRESSNHADSIDSLSSRLEKQFGFTSDIE